MRDFPYNQDVKIILSYTIPTLDQNVQMRKKNELIHGENSTTCLQKPQKLTHSAIQSTPSMRKNPNFINSKTHVKFPSFFNFIFCSGMKALGNINYLSNKADPIGRVRN